MGVALNISANFANAVLVATANMYYKRWMLNFGISLREGMSYGGQFLRFCLLFPSSIVSLTLHCCLLNKEVHAVLHLMQKVALDILTSKSNKKWTNAGMVTQIYKDNQKSEMNQKGTCSK